jgi:hypothetical protein
MFLKVSLFLPMISPLGANGPGEFAGFTMRGAGGKLKEGRMVHPKAPSHLPLCSIEQKA